MGDKYGSDVYLPMPINRDKLGQRKVEKIQREIERLEKEQLDKKELIERLSRMQDNQSRQQEIQNNVLNRHNKDQLLVAEKERNYGRDSAASIKKGENIDDVIAQRTKEFSQRQNAKEVEARFLVQERDRLQAAREKVREQRRALQTMSPAGKLQIQSPKLTQKGQFNKQSPKIQKGSSKKQAPWEFDVLGFLKALGLYHNVDKPLYVTTPLPRKRRWKYRYFPCPMRRHFPWTW